MKQYQLVKYKYGVGPRYTAFCLTPNLSRVRTVERFGKIIEMTHEGAKSSRSRHFQSRNSAEAYARDRDIEIISPDWSVLSGTRIW